MRLPVVGLLHIAAGSRCDRRAASTTGAAGFGRLRVLLAAMLLCALALPASAAYRIDIQAPAPLKDLLTEHLDLARYQEREDLNEDQFKFMLDTVAEQVQKLAATEGYFSPKTTVKVDNAQEVSRISLTVEAGPRTRVSRATVEVSGAARERSPRQVARLQRQWSLTTGEAFRQAEWAAAKQDGLQMLQRRRYPTARIASSEARIYADRQEAELDVDYDSGPLFRLGPLEVSGLHRYSASIIEHVNPLQEGEEYSVERLLEFQRQIQRTPYFSNVVVDIERDPAQAEHAPVRVKVREFPAQRIRAGVGFATDTGARLEGRYSHNDLFGRALVLDTQLRLEQRRQLGAIDLALPPSPGAYVNSVHASTERTTLEGVDLRSRRFGARRGRKGDDGDFAYTLEYYRDELQQLNGATLPPDTVVQPGSHQALVAGVALTRRQVNNPLFPRRGHIVSLEGGVALKGLVTDQTFVRLYSQLRQFLPVGRRDLVILRGELGAVITKGGNAAIPASLLFRAGGTESVRGYSFQGIGNEVNGTVYPTRYLATGGAEYQHWLSEQWGAAVFYDVGTATDNWSDKRLQHGVGIGARWRSPVGRINVDLAYGVQDRKIRPHLSLGVAF